MATNDNVLHFPSAAPDIHRGRRLIPARLVEARLAARLTQTDVANQVGVSRQAVSSYELGEKSPEPDTMLAISRVLGQPISFFTQPAGESFGEYSTRFFRKFGADTKRRNLACEVYGKWLAQAAFVFDGVANYPVVDIPTLEPKSENEHYEADDIEKIAESVRTHFGLGLGPISNIVRLLETKGVIVARLQLSGEQVEAFSFWNGPRPFVFLSSEKESCARARFDVAHELGHLVLHRWVGVEDIEDRNRLKEIEAEANRFAGAFLLPRRSFPNEIYTPKLTAFVDLKLRWKVAIQAMVYRCKDLGIFDELQITNLYKQISFKKWRKREPFDNPKEMPLEEPLLLKKIIELVVKNKVMSVDDIKEKLPFSIETIGQLTGLEPAFFESEEPEGFDLTLK